MAVKVYGKEELDKLLAGIRDGLSDESSQAIFLAAAQAIANRARTLAPKSDESQHPGQLRRAIRAKAFRAGAVRRFGPGAWAQLQLKREYGLNAFYGHIVESGRKPMSYAGAGKVGKPKKAFSWVGISGFRFFTRRVRGFSGRRFFERAVTEAGPAELERAVARLQSLLTSKYGLE